MPRRVWKDLPDRTTPIDADALNELTILTSPNGLVKRVPSIDDNGNFVLTPLETIPALEIVEIIASVGVSSVELSWTDTTTTETAFVVERASDTLFTQGLMTVTVGALTYTDTGVVPGTTYYYRVKAVVGSVDLTLPSNVVAASVPNLPVDPDATQRRNRSMYSKVAMFAPMDETVGTSTAAQRNKRVRGKIDGIFTKRLEEDQAIDPLSALYVQRLVNQVTTFGTGVNLSTFTLPFYNTRWDTPKVHVSDNPAGSQMDLDDSPYKWGTGTNSPWEPGWRSSDAEVASSTYRDRSMVVQDVDNDELWEYFQVKRKGADLTNNPHEYPSVMAEFGGRMANLKDFTGVWPSGPGGATGFGLSGTSIAYGVTFVKFEEVVAGVIPHAIPFAVSVGSAEHRLPATRGDQVGGTDEIPEGARFRLPYDFDVPAFVAAHDISPFCEMYIYAAKTFGLVVADASAGTVGFAVEDLRPAPTYLSNASPWIQYFRSPNTSVFTGSAATNIITSSSHSIQNSHHRKILLNPGFTGGNGLAASPTFYYAGNCTANTFQLFTDFNQTVLVSLGSDVSGTFRKAHETYELLNTSRFPWGSLQLLPAEAAF